jgi:TonB family protein
MFGQLQMLTPTQGVDFTSYLQRVVASVQRNWYAIMPESARLGDQGRVMLQFRIMQNGSVPDAEPQLVSTSNKEPLDRAAMSSIRASSPFEPLPPAFSGPFIELRFIFLYNLPLNAQ